jgi:hypothetical protein
MAGFAMRERMPRRWVIDGLRMAWFRRQPTNGLIFHSDRGRQTADGDLRKQRVTFGTKGAMRRKGDGRDTETRFGSLKVERRREMRVATRRQAKPFDRLRSGDRLAFVLPSPEAARDAGISRPDGLRGKMACRSTKARRIIAQRRGTLTAGKMKMPKKRKPL